MRATKKQRLLVLTGAIATVVLLCTGLWLAALSDPSRFPHNVTGDRQNALFVVGGFVFTLAGIVLLLIVARETTKDMGPEKRWKTNLGVGTAVLFQVAGLFLWSQSRGPAGVAGLMLILISLPVLAWGCMHYAEGKGLPRLVGLVGLAGIIGLMVLIVLPERQAAGT